MKTRLPHFLAALALAAAGPAFAAEPPVAVDVEGLPAHVKARIQEKAAQGQTALIQYLHRTQTVHQLRPQFVVRAAGDGVSARNRQVVQVAGHAQPAR